MEKTASRASGAQGGRRRWRIVRRLVAATAVSILVLAIVAAVTPQGRTAVRTALFIPQVLPTIPIKPQEWFTQDPVWQEIKFPTADGEAVGDLVVPAGSGKHSAVLFFLGVVVDTPRDDPRVVNLAEGLARSGMVVMLPWLATQEEQRIVTDDLNRLVWGFQYLQAHERVDPNKVGMGGICTGASMVTVAAQDERIREEVNFVNFFAGYYDAFDFVRAMGSRSRFYGDEYVAPWEIDKLTYRVFRDHLIQGVSLEEEIKLLISVFVNQQQASHGQVDSLSTEAMAVYGLLSGAPFDEVDGLMEQLSPKTKEFLQLVSPSTNIDKVKARMLIMHDRADRLVPSEESRRFAEALDRQGDVYYTEFSFFQNEIQVHKDESGGVGPLDYAKEAYKLFLHMYNILRDVA